MTGPRAWINRIPGWLRWTAVAAWIGLLIWAAYAASTGRYADTAGWWQVALGVLGLPLVVNQLFELWEKLRGDRGQAITEGDRERARRARSIMLERVWHSWIEGVLERSLYKVARLDLGMVEAPDAVQGRPWRMVTHIPGQADRLLPRGGEWVAQPRRLCQATSCPGRRA